MVLGEGVLFIYYSYSEKHTDCLKQNGLKYENYSHLTKFSHKSTCLLFPQVLWGKIVTVIAK